MECKKVYKVSNVHKVGYKAQTPDVLLVVGEISDGGQIIENGTAFGNSGRPQGLVNDIGAYEFSASIDWAEC